MPTLITAELILDDVDDTDLDAIVAIRRSNPARLARTEGTDAGPGEFDRGMLERDLALVAFDPSRHFLCARLKREGRIVGYVDILDAHPDDGTPWLGAVEISASHQRQGYGRQCVEAVTRRAGDELGAAVLRAAVDRGDTAGLGFLEHVGFVTVAASERRSPLGPVAVAILERPIGG
jgi:RimJ/RimL family protein N-acetyltransferase